MLINESQTLVPTSVSGQLNFTDLFDAQVAKSPNAIALIYGEQKFTYQELDERANRLAGYLISLGVQPDAPVGVCITRSLDMVVAIIGVIKAGGAYLPLDPAYPVDRLSFILEDACARIVVTQSALLGLFQDQEITAVCLDVDEQEISRFPASKPETAVSAENLVYVIYTSGSTGKPKGVMITHSSLVNFIEVACSALDVNPDDVYLQSATIAYALSVRQLMVPLVVGATIVVASSAEIGDPLELFSLIKRRNITLMDMVPSFWRNCIQRLSQLPQDEQTALLDNSLRRIVSIGEALMSDLPRDWTERFGQQVKLVNIFGQTETTGVVATYPIPRDVQAGFGVVPIGRSASHTKLYILDSKLRPVPDGEMGELCVSNPCLARGYLNRPDLTAEKFTPNPFNDGFSDRLYRTGDIARCRSDGNIEFLGRGDQQVKIRGQRLELGEVEAALREHQAVRDCVIMARGDNPDDKYLAAYVVITPGSRLTPVEFKEFMRKRLPEYMVPAVIIFLDALPLNPNGKINRLALPDPKTLGAKEQHPEGDIVPPRNQVEKTIAHIWQDVMKLDEVGIHDNFFDLGGHSLMAVRILTRIERDLGVRLPLTSLFHSVTISQLAELVNRREDEVRSWSPLVAIQTNGNKPPFFGIHAVGGGVLFWGNIVGHLPKDQPFYALQAQGVDGVRPALDRIEDMASLYLGEIRKVQPHSPYYLGGFSLGGEIAFEIGQQLIRQGEKVDLLVMLDTRNPVRVIRPVLIEGDVEIPVVQALTPVSGYEILKRKARGHFRKLSQLSPLRIIAYIGKQMAFHAKHVVVSSFVKMFRLLRRRLPDYLLLRYLRINHRVAIRNYVPTLYPGRITIFRANETLETNPIDSPMGWAPLAGGGLEVHYFDAPHEMIKHEYAEPIARKLNECILSARVY
jgi:aspartate racemase